jgi:hypothetical protein
VKFINVASRRGYAKAAGQSEPPPLQVLASDGVGPNKPQQDFAADSISSASAQADGEDDGHADSTRVRIRS